MNEYMRQVLMRLIAANRPSSPPVGLVSPGNIDLRQRIQNPVKNPDGSTSTVLSMSFGDEHGREVLVPTVVGGKVVSEKEAVDNYYRTGEHLGIFDNPDNATAYAIQLHNEQAQNTVGFNPRKKIGK